MNDDKAIATLTIIGASEMTPKRQEELADWLDAQKETLLYNSRALNHHYTARYIVNERKSKRA